MPIESLYNELVMELEVHVIDYHLGLLDVLISIMIHDKIEWRR